MKTVYDISEYIYFPFTIKEIHVNTRGQVTYTLEAVAPFMYYTQTGIAQKDIIMYGLSGRKGEVNEENI